MKISRRRRSWQSLSRRHQMQFLSQLWLIKVRLNLQLGRLMVELIINLIKKTNQILNCKKMSMKFSKMTKLTQNLFRKLGKVKKGQHLLVSLLWQKTKSRDLGMTVNLALNKVWNKLKMKNKVPIDLENLLKEEVITKMIRINMQLAN